MGRVYLLAHQFSFFRCDLNKQLWVSRDHILSLGLPEVPFHCNVVSKRCRRLLYIIIVSPLFFKNKVCKVHGAEVQYLKCGWHLMGTFSLGKNKFSENYWRKCAACQFFVYYMGAAFRIWVNFHTLYENIFVVMMLEEILSWKILANLMTIAA